MASAEQMLETFELMNIFPLSIVQVSIDSDRLSDLSCARQSILQCPRLLEPSARIAQNVMNKFYGQTMRCIW
jgi:hypothetical protein